MITQSFSSPMLAEGIGAFTSQFKKGGMTKKNTKKKLSKRDMELIHKYAEGGEVTKKDKYEVGDKIKYMDTFRREENDGTIYQINELGTYIVSTGMGVRGVQKEEVIGVYPKEEPKKKRFGLFAKGGGIKHNYSSARTQGRDNQDLEKELKDYAGENYNNLTAEERRQIISDMQKYSKGGEVTEKDIKKMSRVELMRYLSSIDPSYPIFSRRDDKDRLLIDAIKLTQHKSSQKNFAEGGTTDPKPTAQDILKRLGYNIPQSEEMQEEEPKIIRGYVDDEPYYFAKGGMSKDDSPKVYIADLSEYNNGRLVGKWFDLTDYSNGAELMQDIQQMLDEQTKKDKFGDVHEEYAVHDYENFPRDFYSEYMGEADFDKLISLINDAEDSNLPFDVIAKAMADLGKDEVSEVVEAYFGSVSPSMGNEWRDFAYEYVENVGGIMGVSNADYYFDYESFGSDERINMGGEAEEEMGYEDLDDTELGEQLVEEVGGIEALDKSTIEMYFDYDKFGRDLQYDFTAIRGEDGDYYFFNSNFKKGGKLKSKPTNEDEGEYVLSEDEKKIIRGYVDDEPYYFAEGGEITADEKRKSLKGNAKLKF